MLKRSIKYPLLMKDGEKVRSIEELRKHFDIESILDYYFDGRLSTWLDQRFYHEEVRLLRDLKDCEFLQLPRNLTEVFKVEFTDHMQTLVQEYFFQKNKREQLKGYDHLPDNLDLIAFSQEELQQILQSDEKVVYLFGDQFEVSDDIENVKYIGINQPTVSLRGNGKFEARKKNIAFKNINLTSKEMVLLSMDQQGVKDNTINEEKIVKRSHFTNFVHGIKSNANGGYQLNGIAEGYFHPINKIYLYKDVVVLSERDRMLLINHQTGKSIQEIKRQYSGDINSCKDGNRLNYHFEYSGQNTNDLYEFNLDTLIARVIKKDFFNRQGTENTTILERIGDCFYRWSLYDTYMSGSVTYFDFYKYDSKTFRVSDAHSYSQYRTEHKVTYFIHHDQFYSAVFDQFHINGKKAFKLEGSLGLFAIHENSIFGTPANNGSLWNQLGETGQIVILDLGTGKVKKKVQAHNSEIKVIKDFNDNLYTLSEDGTIKVWDLPNLDLLHTIKIPPGYRGGQPSFGIDFDDDKMAVLYKSNVLIFE
ncbi:hypothetical protein [Bacillus sp. FJAT-29814]|uniref:hypothetical protein n=1 Tax=Bacillus sp. FJAT-29814 TaxID=1729688 RepID=UPI000A631C90|nr:hypothetical protein [Bacillus sp. FJAT-29814]